MGWRDRKKADAETDAAAAPPGTTIVMPGEDLSRAEIRLRCVECAMTMRTGAASVENIIGGAEKFFAWIVEETPPAK